MTDIEGMILRRARQCLSDLSEAEKSNLIRLTADYANNHVSWQVIVGEEADEDEIEEYRCIFTEVLSDFYDATGDEDIIKAKSSEEAASTRPLPIAIYP